MRFSLPRLCFEYQAPKSDFRLIWGTKTVALSEAVGFRLAQWLPLYVESSELRSYAMDANLDLEQLPLLLELEYPGFVPLAFAPKSSAAISVSLLPEEFGKRLKKTWILMGDAVSTLWGVRRWQWLMRWGMVIQLCALLAYWGIHPLLPHSTTLYAEGKADIQTQTAFRKRLLETQRQAAINKIGGIVQLLDQSPDGCAWSQGRFDFQKNRYQLQAYCAHPQLVMSWSLARGWRVDQSEHSSDHDFKVTLSAVDHSLSPSSNTLDGSGKILTLDQFNQRWSQQLQQWQHRGQIVDVTTGIDLDQLQRLVVDFPGILKIWQFNAESGLSHHLQFQVL